MRQSAAGPMPRPMVCLLLTMVLSALAACGPAEPVASSVAAPASPLPSPEQEGPPGQAPGPLAVSLTGVPTHLRDQDIERIPTARRVVALTFDGGASEGGLTSILRTLQSKGVPATFFLTGYWMERNHEELRQIAATFPVYGHSYSHPNFTEISDEDIRSEVERGTALISTMTGQPARPFFRFPSGDRDVRTIRVVNDLGYIAVRWTVDTLGWMGTSRGYSVQSVRERVREAMQPGMIVLMHVGYHPEDHSTLDADALPAVIEDLQAAGYEFVTLNPLLQ